MLLHPPSKHVYDGAVMTGASVFVEDWAATYGSPYLVAGDDEGRSDVRLLEDGERLEFHPGRSDGVGHEPLAFVDGVRRGEAALYRYSAGSGELVRGAAGSHARGAVLADGAHRAGFLEESVDRIVIWAGEEAVPLPEVPGGWSWQVAAVRSEAPEAPLAELQERMRREEAVLAESLSDRGLLVLCDGPLSYVRSTDRPIVGYVKTHHRALLDPADHARIPVLGPGQRTSVFGMDRTRYSCYLRIAPTSAVSGPWAGIVRLEVPQSAGLDAAVDTLDRVAGILPAYAGIPHQDARAPQNLQPVGALERRLRHLLGDAGLAARAVRQAVWAMARHQAAEE